MASTTNSDRQRLLALIDPFQKVPPPRPDAQPGTHEAYGLRLRCGWLGWRHWIHPIASYFVFSGVCILVSIFGSLFMMSGNWQFGVVLWLIGTALFCALPWGMRWLWGREYRSVYYDMSRSDLPLRIADPERWKQFLHPDGIPTGTGLTPQTIYDALRLATFHWYELRSASLPGEAGFFEWLAQLHARLRPRGYATNQLARAAMEMQLSMQIPGQEPDVSARYAAMYDYFFAPQQRFHEAAAKR